MNTVRLGDLRGSEALAFIVELGMVLMTVVAVFYMHGSLRASAGWWTSSLSSLTAPARARSASNRRSLADLLHQRREGRSGSHPLSSAAPHQSERAGRDGIEVAGERRPGGVLVAGLAPVSTPAMAVRAVGIDEHRGDARHPGQLPD
jgi:hypothetical protein